MLPQTMIAGIIISFLYYEIIGLSPGGIIVCGYLVFYVRQPERILATLLISILVLVIGRLLEKQMILFGRRKFAIYVLLGIFVNYLLSSGAASDIIPAEIAGIGYFVPGLIALDMDRQGIIQTLVSIGIVLGLLTIFVWLIIN